MLAFLHWPIDPAVIRPLIPQGLELDTFEGQAWIGIVPFRMEATRVRFAPPLPSAHEFAELNVRTYARHGSRSGVWFFSLDAASRVAVRAARLLFNLPYYDAEMRIEREGATVRYRSNRVHAGAAPARFDGRYIPVGPVFRAVPGTLDHFLAERYCLFARSRRGELGVLDIHHAPWPLQRATAAIEINTMVDGLGIRLPAAPPVAHFAECIDVAAWNLEAFTE